MNSNTFSIHIIFQSDKPNGIWFVPDGAAATWRPAWWRITQEPDTIIMCFAWRDGVQAKVRTYVRHRGFQFYWSAGASAGDFKMLLPLSLDGRWNRCNKLKMHDSNSKRNSQWHCRTASPQTGAKTKGCRPFAQESGTAHASTSIQYRC